MLISPEAISLKLKEVAITIDAEYENEPITIVMVMKGAICVTADLIRNIKTPCTLECISASSYGLNGTKQGELVISGLEKIDLTSKHVLVVDDIFDSGKTMVSIVEKLQNMNPKSLKTLVLLQKKIPRTITYRPDYVLFEIENRFVIGYGLDYKEYFRGLPGVYAFINDIPPKI